MYKCDDCGHIFEDGEEQIVRENHGECFGFPAYESYGACPMCGGTFEEVKPCKICGTFKLKKHSEYCNACIKDIQRRVDVFVEREFTAEEQELFRELYGEGE
jgi:RecJ-like exonuclease